MTRRRLFGSARSRQALDDLDRDIRDHLERETEDNIDRGMAPDEARRQAMLAFGNVALAKEDTRRVWVWAWLDEARQDLRYAARTLLKNPAFATTAAATLALAIGANTTMFSVLNAVLLRPLPYRSSEQLAMLWTEDPTQNLREGRSALWDVEQWQSQSQSFAGMATFDSVGTVLTGADGVEQIVGASISPNLLPLLGVQPILGRNFSTEEGEQRQRLVLISHRFWQARFAGSHEALNATLVINGLPSQIIGILPADFQVARFDADVWEPHPTHHSVRGGQVWFVIARLRPRRVHPRALLPQPIDERPSSSCRSSTLRQSSRRRMIAGSSGLTTRKTRRSVRDASATTWASRRSSFAPPAVKRSRSDRAVCD